MSIYEDWLQAKRDEQQAQKLRRELEDQMAEALGLDPQYEGTVNFQPDGWKVKVQSRLNRRIDGDKLQEIAAENGLMDHLSSLFRWKPEIQAKAWKAASPAITEPLLDAITTTPGRPTFTITPNED